MGRLGSSSVGLGAPLLCGLLAFALAGRAGAEEEAQAARRFAREQLLRTAAQAVDAARIEGPGLAELREALAQRRAALAGTPGAAAALEAAGELLGAAEGPAGLLAEAARLGLWLREETPAGAVLVLVDPTRNGAPAAEFPPEVPAELTEAQRDAFKRHALRLKLRADDATLPVPGIDGLRALARTPREGFRRALVLPDELGWDLCRALVRAWQRQAEVRREAYAKEAPQGHVNEGTVREKRERVERVRRREAALVELRTRLEGALDEMAAAERHWRRQAGRIGFQVEDAKRRAEAGEAPAGGDPPLGVLELEELVAEQELRLLYLAVRRTETRLALLGDALRAVEGEALAADAVLRRFDDELSRLRRERQLDRLHYDAGELAQLIKETRQELEGLPADQRPLRERYLAGAEALLELNQAAAQAVQIRQRLEVGAPRAPAGEPAAGAPAEGPVRPPAEAGAPDLLAEFRAPAPESIDEAYVRRARAQLDGPAWTTAVVAANYEAADVLAGALRRALAQAEAIRPLTERSAALARVAQEHLEAVAGGARNWDLRFRARDALRRQLPSARDAFDETVRGIEEQRRRAQERLGVLAEFRRALLGLGDRSLGVREHRRLTGERLGAALTEAAAGLVAVRRWLLLEDEPHLGTFVARHALALLLALAFLVVALLGVRFGRRAIDRRLTTLAARIPELRRTGAGIGAEEERARRAQAERDAALAAAAEALTAVPEEVREAPPEPAAGPPPPAAPGAPPARGSAS